MLAFLVLVEMCELVAETARSDVDAAKVLGKVHRVLELFVEMTTRKNHTETNANDAPIFAI